MKLNKSCLQNRSEWEAKGYHLPQYDHDKMVTETKARPFWVHFGAGNLFRAFHARLVEDMLNSGTLDRGLIAVEGFDYEIIDKQYTPHDNFSIVATLKADGSIEKSVVGSVAEAIPLDSENPVSFDRLKEIFTKDSLQLATFTITEKGYRIVNEEGQPIDAIAADLHAGPEKPMSYMGKVTALLYARYLSGKKPIAMVSTDNCSHNGDRLYTAIAAFAKAWEADGKVMDGFADYIESKLVSFPWTMIDKITPRPDPSVEAILAKDGVEDLKPSITSKNTHTALFVNAEETEYLVIEDCFPNGRPKQKDGSLMFTDRETVDKVERMKVCTCLNPLHTSLAIFGCLLGYQKISDEMKDPELKKLVEIVGYQEGLPVVVDPGILEPKTFLDTVLHVRIPNPFMPDTPQRIATDTSQKLAIRFGETIKAYAASDVLDVSSLRMIPLVLAGWLRYLMGIDDNGASFELSSDPLLDVLCPMLSGIKLGQEAGIEEIIRPILKNTTIFGVDLYEVGLADKVCKYFREMIAGVGAVRETLKKNVPQQTNTNATEQLQKIGIVPIVILHDINDAAPLAKALTEGGLPCAEITFRTDAAEEAIRIMTTQFPDMLVGAGTILTKTQANQAISAGADFIVCPGFDSEIVDYCQKQNVAVFPGCVTPSDAAQAVKHGLKTIKFFPAESFGGVDTIKALAAPYPTLNFMPTGGISPSNLRRYLSHPKVIACGGSWMVNSDLIKEGRFEEISALAKEAVQLVAQIRSKKDNAGK